MAATATNLQSELQKILDGLGDMPGIVGKLGDVVSKLASALTPLQNAISRLFSNAEDTVLETAQVAQQSVLTAAVNRNSASTDANTAATNRLSGVVGTLNSIMSSLVARINASLQGQGLQALGGKSPLMLGGGAAPPGEEGGAGGAAAGGLSALGKLAAVAGVAAAAIGVMVVGINLAEREFQKLQSLVRLFNPAVIQTFQYALDNLGATIGRAFVPLFQAATSVVREWTAALAPVIQKLTPIIQQFSDAFANLAVPMLRQLASVLQALLPSFRQIAEVVQLVATNFASMFQVIAINIRSLALLGRLFYELSGMGIVVRVLTKAMEAFSKVFEVFEAAFSIMETVVTSLVDSLGAFLQTLFPIKSVMEQLNKAVQSVIRNMYVFAIMLAKFLGLDGVVNALLASIEGKLKRGDTAAQNPQIKSLEQLSKDLALAASTAAGAAGKGGVRNEQEFWKQTLDQMRQAEANGVSIKQLLEKILNALNPFGKGGGAENPPPGPANAGVGGVFGAGDAAQMFMNPGAAIGRGVLGRMGLN